MGKFFNNSVKSSKSTMIKVGIIGVCAVLIIVILISINKNKNKPTPHVKMYNNLELNINDEKPDKLDFFSEFDNYDESNVSVKFPDDFDMSVVGEYDVTVTINKKDYTCKVKVVDNEPPTLEVKDLEIDYGSKYYIEDFVTSCKDNSNESCTIEYYKLSKDQDGKIIDYSNYTDPGNYLIKIIAKDINGNSTDPKSVLLTIKDKNGNKPNNNGDDDKQTTTPTDECKYGDLSVDTNIYTHPIAVIVGDEQNNCALNYRELWDDETTQQPAVDMLNKDLDKLKNDFKKIFETKFPDGAQTYIYQDIKAVLNSTTEGLVGYSIYVKLYATNANEKVDVDMNDQLIAEYYLKSDGSREYIQNPYNIN